MPGCAGPSIILSLIGGYPVGAKGVKSLFDSGEITQPQANRMLRFMVNSGPAFTISAVGATMLGSSQIGIILFISQITSALIIGILSGLAERCTNKKVIKCCKNKLTNEKTVPEAIVESCSDAAEAMINMCALVTLFSALISILNSFDIFNRIAECVSFSRSSVIALLTAFFEVTSGCNYAAVFKASIEIICFSVGFGGLCVHFQVFSMLKGIKINYAKFYLYRILNGCLSAVIFWVLIRRFKNIAQVFSTIESIPATLPSNTKIGAVALVFLCACYTISISPFLIGTKNITKKTKQKATH